MICVDPSVKYTTGYRRYSAHMACYMFSDDGDLESLHHIGRLIGLRREWFQQDNDPPHYDLIGKGKRDLAVAYGATEVSRRYPIRVRRKNGQKL